MTSQVTEAIVLKSRDYQDHDRVVTFFSRDYGKIVAFAKSAKKSTKRFGPLLEPPLWLQITFKEKRGSGLVFLERVSLKKGFASLFNDLKRMSLAWYFLELTDLLTVDHDASPGKFEHLAKSLSLLESESLLANLASYFEYHLLRLSGMAPVVDDCLRCQKGGGDQNRFFFVFSEGGTVCSDCLRSGESFEILEPVDLRPLQMIHQQKAFKQIPPATMKTRSVLLRFLDHHLPRQPRSRFFLEKWPDIIPGD